MQRTIVLAALAVYLMTGAAQASWSGCGVSAGVVRETTTTTTEVIGTSLDLGSTGTAASIGLGCDYQLDRVVIGGLARYELGVDTGSVAGGLLKWEQDRKWMVAARAGFLVNEGLLAYGLVGVHGLNQSLDIATISADAKPTGMVLGIGAEAMLSKHISIRLEGTWATASSTFSDIGGYTIPGGLHLKPESQAFRAEVVWHLMPIK